jgi:DnaD and phage-associated domain
MESIFTDIEMETVKTAPKLEAPLKPPASNKVISNKKEVINNKQKIISNKQSEKAIKCFENNIHYPKQDELSRLHSWCSTMGCDIVIMAIEKAVQYNVKNMNYIDKIMNNWIKDGIRAAENSFKKNMSGWNLTNERKYDFKELERKLLGW